MPEDVDYKVMATFFEFYETLLNFVMFKLYNDMGVRYPLSAIEGSGEVKGSTTYILGANLRSLNNAMTSTDGAITNVISETLLEGEKTEKHQSRDKSTEEKKKDRALMKTVSAALDNIQEDDNERDDDDDDEEKGVDIAGPLKVALESMEEEKVRSSIPTGETQLDDEAIKRRRLFAGFTFFLSREVPRGYLELISLAYGANVGWEGPNSPITAKDPSITHHVVDRPKLLSSYDSLPKSREFVQPQWILDCTNFMFLLPIDKYGVGKSLPPHLSPWVDNEEEGYKPAYAEEIDRLKNGEVIEEADKEEDDSIAVEADEVTNDDDDENEDVSEVDDDDEDDEDDKKEDTKKKKARAKKRREEEEKEAHELAKSMMSRKAAHLYGRMQHGISKKQARVEDLEIKRREPLQNKEKDDDGKSMRKQKVERLKRERKKIQDDYKDTGGSMKKSKKKRRST